MRIALFVALVLAILAVAPLRAEDLRTDPIVLKREWRFCHAAQCPRHAEISHPLITRRIRWKAYLLK